VTSGRRLCLALRPAGRATSSGFARDKGCPGGALGLRILSNTGRARCRFVFGGELLLAIIRLHSVIRKLRCYRQRKRSVNKVKGASGFTVFTVPLAPYLFQKPATLLCELGFATSRRLREEPQCVRRFGPALLLKLRNPSGYSFHHITRRLTSGICLCLDDWAGFFALLYDSNCFLLRHCYFSSSYECFCIQRNSRHTVP